MITCIVTSQHIYRMTQVSVSSLNDLVPEVITSQNCQINIGMLLKGYRAMDVCSIACMMSQLTFVARSKSLWLECNFEHQFCVNIWWYSSQSAICLFIFKHHRTADMYSFCRRNCHICSELYLCKDNCICICDMMKHVTILGMPCKYA